MKYFFLLSIRIYQALLSPLQTLFPAFGCRFYPSCSQYAYGAVKKYGAAGGVKLAFLRFLKCNPWSF